MLQQGGHSASQTLPVVCSENKNLNIDRRDLSSAMTEAFCSGAEREKNLHKALKLNFFGEKGEGDLSELLTGWSQSFAALFISH